MNVMTVTMTMAMEMGQCDHYGAGEPEDQQPQHRGHLRLAEDGEVEEGFPEQPLARVTPGDNDDSDDDHDDDSDDDNDEDDDINDDDNGDDDGDNLSLMRRRTHSIYNIYQKSNLSIYELPTSEAERKHHVDHHSLMMIMSLIMVIILMMMMIVLMLIISGSEADLCGLCTSAGRKKTTQPEPQGRGCPQVLIIGWIIF